MEGKSEKINSNLEVRMVDSYCVISNKEDNFYWVLNLEDHPNSFLLDRSFQNFISPNSEMHNGSMVVFQPSL